MNLSKAKLKRKKTTDKERLDWLEKVGPSLSICVLPYYENKPAGILSAPGWGTANWHISSLVSGVGQGGITLRAAIDSGMSGTDPKLKFHFASENGVCPYCEQEVRKGKKLSEKNRLRWEVRRSDQAGIDARAAIDAAMRQQKKGRKP